MACWMWTRILIHIVRIFYRAKAGVIHFLLCFGLVSAFRPILLGLTFGNIWPVGTREPESVVLVHTCNLAWSRFGGSSTHCCINKLLVGYVQHHWRIHNQTTIGSQFSIHVVTTRQHFVKHTPNDTLGQRWWWWPQFPFHEDMAPCRILNVNTITSRMRAQHLVRLTRVENAAPEEHL